MMNSELVEQAAAKLAAQLLAPTDLTDAKRVELAYVKAYGRPPNARELVRAQNFLSQFERTVSAQKPDAKDCRAQAWAVLCQTILAANEFIYLN